MGFVKGTKATRLKLYDIWKDFIEEPRFTESFPMSQTEKLPETMDMNKKTVKIHRTKNPFTKFDSIKSDADGFTVRDIHGQKILYDAAYYDLCQILALLMDHLQKILQQLEWKKLEKKVIESHTIEKIYFGKIL